MHVVLLRHGVAASRDSARWPDDRERPLTGRGETRARGAARGLRTLIGRGATILTSPLERARATATLVGEVLDAVTIEPLEALAPGGTHRKLLDALAPHAGADVLVLIGHEPDLGRLAGLWVFNARCALSLKKAGACAIEFRGRIRSGEGRLLWFLQPRALRSIRSKRARE